MPINQDKTDTTSRTATSTPTSTPAQDKPSSGMNTAENKPAAPINVPGRMENNQQSNKPDAARTTDADKQAESDRDKKFGKSPVSPSTGI